MWKRGYKKLKSNWILRKNGGLFLYRYAQENVNKILIGNKSDMADKRKVSFDEGTELGKNIFKCPIYFF